MPDWRAREHPGAVAAGIGPSAPSAVLRAMQVSAGSFIKRTLFNWGFQRKLHALNEVGGAAQGVRAQAGGLVHP